MAYDRSEIGKRIAQVEQEQTIDGREPLAGDVVDEVVRRGICGRGVAQQVLAEQRKGRKTRQDEAALASVTAPLVPEDMSNILAPFDELHLSIDRVKLAVGRTATASISDVRSTFSSIIADQGVATQRADEANRTRIEMLDAALTTAQDELVAKGIELADAEKKIADLRAIVSEGQAVREANAATIQELNDDAERQKLQLASLRDDVEATRRDLAASRGAESMLREELQRASAGYVDQAELMSLRSQCEVLTTALNDERARNADLHNRLLGIVGAVVRPSAESGKAPAN